MRAAGSSRSDAASKRWRSGWTPCGGGSGGRQLCRRRDVRHVVSSMSHASNSRPLRTG